MSAQHTPGGKLAPRPEDDDIDSRDKPCTCSIEAKRVTDPQTHCAKHGILASLARENRYWQRVGRD